MTEYLEEKVEEVGVKLDEIRNDALLNNKKSQEYNEKYFERHHRAPSEFSVGDFVIIKNVDTSNTRH